MVGDKAPAHYRQAGVDSQDQLLVTGILSLSLPAPDGRLKIPRLGVLSLLGPSIQCTPPAPRRGRRSVNCCVVELFSLSRRRSDWGLLLE
jgi:hypothetical protein